MLDESGNMIIDDEGNATITDEAIDAIDGNTCYDLSKIIIALLADHPYQLYWYEKTQETSSTGYGITAFYDETVEDYVAGIDGSFTISLPVAAEYSAGEYMVDVSVGQAVQHSVENANLIVQQYSNAADYEKLCGYKEEICELVSYNQEAAAGGVSYGNPWQMIWVFDGDPNTSVVCEGYAKAFKYLCDQTDFVGDINCITVTGTMSDGSGEEPHMWNIVNMEDDQNYLVDVTNCDEGMIGEPDQLFLTRYSVLIGTNGYLITTENGDVSYSYDQNTLSLYETASLTLSQVSYQDALDEETIEYIEDGIVYSITGENAKVVGYKGTPVDVVLPGTVNGATVKRISGSAFMQCGTLRSICIASTIEEIEDGQYNGWEDLGPDFSGAFFECKALQTVTFEPDSKLRIIGKFAFLRCESLSSIMLPSSVEVLKESALDSCTGLSGIILPEGLKKIGQNALSLIPVKTLVLPSTLEFFHPWCQLDEIESFEVADGNETFKAEDGVLYEKTDDGWQLWFYPLAKKDDIYHVPNFVADTFDGAVLSGVKYLQYVDIGKRKFNEAYVYGQLVCSYYSLNVGVIVDDENPYYSVKDDILYSKDMTKLLQCPSSVKGHFEIPEHVQEIDKWAFDDCIELTSVGLPAHIKSLVNTFEDCTSLTDIELPYGIETLDGTFVGCTSLTSIELPESIKILIWRDTGSMEQHKH